jgi:lipopolysaccharide transport system permease protein
MSEASYIISAKRKSLRKVPAEIFKYRHLLYTLAWRDVKVQYAQTFFGVMWALVNPLITLFVLTFVFGTVAKTDVDGVPHALYTLAGMCGWTYFSAVFSQAGNSIVGAQSMVKKVYFPRLIIPLSKALTALIDFAILLLSFIVLAFIYEYPLSSNLWCLPFFIFMVILSGLAGGVWMSALTIRYRDIHHIAPLLVRLGLFITPIAYSAASVPEKYQVIYYLNPMAGVVEGMKWCLLGSDTLPSPVWLSLASVIVLICTGAFYFSRIESKIADLL